MTYSEVIASARKALGLSQQQLADLVGVQQPTVQRWEKGARAPEIDAIPKLAEVLGVERHLLTDIDYSKLGLAPATDEHEPLLRALPHLKQRDKQTLRDLAERLRRDDGDTAAA